MCQGSLKVVSWQFQRRSKEVSRVFEESVKCVFRNFKKKKGQGGFKNVSMKFCFTILFIAATREGGGLVQLEIYS